jgi:hypothetical protein
VRSLRRVLIRRGLAPDADGSDADTLASDEPLLAEIYSASVRSRTAIGERAGRRVLRIGDLVDPEEAALRPSPRCASIDGVSLHANVAVPARDRRRLEKLCRYVARPPLTTQRLSRLDDGRLLYKLKHRWRDGTTHVIFEPLELLEKLVAIVPPPRFHVVRYHGVLAPRAGSRREIVRDRRQPRREHRSTVAMPAVATAPNVPSARTSEPTQSPRVRDVRNASASAARIPHIGSFGIPKMAFIQVPLFLLAILGWFALGKPARVRRVAVMSSVSSSFSLEESSTFLTAFWAWTAG